MELKNLLFILTSDADQDILSTAVKLSKNLGLKLFVLFVIEPNRVTRLASITHQNAEALHEEIEEQGWELLYLVEDDAVENGVWTSLHLEDGNMMSIVKKYIETYKIDALIMKRRDEIKKIFISSPVPVIGL